jgi:L-alanine-DL-glutamate epimerase-like enolase superfamily enzyme
VEARLRAPFISARRSIESVPLLLVSLTDDDGYTGHGEALDLPGVRAELEARGTNAAGTDAQAAIDLARWDLEGRRAGQPVWRLLGAEAAPAVEVNATIANHEIVSPPPDFRCVKLKVGLGDDTDRVAAVRAAVGPEIAIRLDANGAWSVDEAISTLRALEPHGIELCEEPSAGVEACARVAAASPVPVALDESALDALNDRVCDAVCLKVSRTGGISGVLDAAARARRAGYGVYLASMLDGPLGIAAALHAAAAVGPDYACGLATLGLFDGRPDPLPPSGGRIALPAGPGLGDGLLAWYNS